MTQNRVSIKTIAPDDALRSSDFTLLPTNEKPPVITSHPLRNFYQLTWRSVSRTGKFTLKTVQPILDTFTIRKGTAIEWSLYCVDPSNLSNINDTSNIKFVWKRNGYELHSFNRQNGGRGVSTIQYSEEQSTEEIEGEYTCEVSNQTGTTTSSPFSIRILDLDNSKQLYTNLIINGDADGGLEGWTNGDGNVITVPGKDKVLFNQNTITSYSEYYPISTGSNYLPRTPFRFNTKIPDNYLFYKGYKTWLDATDGQLLDYNVNTETLESNFPEWLRWSSFTQRASVIPNEDYQQTSNTRQGFFPGPNYIDKYNRNDGIGLSVELGDNSRPLNYFTRTNLQFNQNPTTEFSQTIPLTGLESLIQGTVGGVNNLTAQVFAYVGIALSRCTIRVTIGGVNVDYNWLIHDLDTYREYLSGVEVPKIIPDTGTPIEIIQHTDDTTTLNLEILDASDTVIKTEKINGPQTIDLWAVKEKIDFALTLFPIFAFFENRSNPIQVFGQTYTNTSALSDLFQTSGDTGFLDKSNINKLNVRDINAEFLAKRYGNILRAEYGDIWEEQSTSSSDVEIEVLGINITSPGGNYIKVNPIGQKRALSDLGIQAFFAVGAAVDLPPTTSRIRLAVRFTNTSPSLTDSTPETKGWTEADIYNTVFSVSSTTAAGGIATTTNPLYKYGEPRCAVTKIKVQIVPDRDVASPKHTTYALPPASSTVSGIARDLLSRDVHNTSYPSSGPKPVFAYRLIQPQGLPPAPNPNLSDTQQLEENEARVSYATNERAGNLDPLQTPPADLSPEALELARNFAKDSINTEEIDRLEGRVVGVIPEEGEV